MFLIKRFCVVGCGGIGSWLIPPLARFLTADGFDGELVLFDGDKYENKNSDRQDFDAGQTGENKAIVQCSRLQAMFPRLRTRAVDQYITGENIEVAVLDNDVVFVAVDNHPARNLIDTRAATLKNICIFSGGNEEFDGNVHVFYRRGNKDITTRLTDRHPEVSSITRGDRADASCEELIEAGNTQYLVTNFMAAATFLTAFHTVYTRVDKKDKTKSPKHLQEVVFDVKQLAMGCVTV